MTEKYIDTGSKDTRDTAINAGEGGSITNMSASMRLKFHYDNNGTASMHFILSIHMDIAPRLFHCQHDYRM
jgi:hypothetical protein